MNNSTETQTNGQYSLVKILGIWFLGGAPLWIFGWLVFPAISQSLPAFDKGLLWMKFMLSGLVWQFLLSMFILYREEGNIRISTIRRRFWLNNPISPRTGQKDNRLWWLIIPLMLGVIAIELGISPVLNDIWTKIFPFLAEPPSRSLDGLFAPEYQGLWFGAWDFFALFVVVSLFNNFLSEEFLFRGVLLPKMKGVFGKWDWVANGFIFGMYHLHMPWGIPGNILFGLLVAFSGKRFRSNWFPIILHNGQALYFGFLILGLVLGLA
ncbi:MAG TPA: CPBP family intramembrane glutamic endopeptidase [Anaerolineales bacterium]|nr:CPBP family intramembrane glutamic endopeptidase [Anaerolineales bacterium]